MKNVSRRTFLGTAIGTGIVGSTALAGIPILPKQIQSLFPNAEPNPTESATIQNTIIGASHYEPVPGYLHWTFGNQYRSTPVEAKSFDFNLWFSPVAERKQYDFRKEVFAKCAEIDQMRNGKTVALCHGGGENSEIIAHALKQLGIPFEMYFLDYGMLNDYARKDFAEPLAKKLSIPLHVVSVGREYFEHEFIPNDLLAFGSDHPSVMMMRYLFSAIPNNYFIVTGSGNLERSGDRTNKIASETTPSEEFLPYSWTFSSNHVAYYDWAKKNNRPGEYYFYQSSPGLLLSVLESPQVQNHYPNSNIKGLIYSAFPEVTPRAKTTNWDKPAGRESLARLRDYIDGVALKHGLSYWRLSSGCHSNIAGLYKV